MMTEKEALKQGTAYRQNAWKAFRFVLPYLKPYLSRVIAVCFIDLSITLLNLVIPWLGKYIIDVGFANRDWVYVVQIAVMVALLSGSAYALSGVRTFLYNTTDMLLGLELRRAMYGHLQTLSLETVESLPIGQMQFRVTTDSDRIAHMLVRILPTATMLVEFALILAAAIYVDPVMAGVVLLFLFPWTALFIWVTHYGRILDRRRLHCVESRDAGVLQAGSSFATIKALGRSRREMARHGRASVAAQRVANEGYLILVFFEFATQKLIPFAKQTTIFLSLARKVVLGEMTLGMTAPMIAYLGRLTYPIERIVNFGCWIWQTMVSAERMMQILTTKPAITDAPDAVRLQSVTGDLRFEGVSFERDGVGKVLDNVSLDLRPGKVVAVVGPSGAGKSTLVSLALRLIDPMEGKVTVDGNELKTLHRTTYLRNVATVNQDTFLFGGTLSENLRIVNSDASDEDLWRVLTQVGLKDWADALPDKLDSDLEGGLGLSVGQMQRLGIARAFLTNAKILILDEPTSALDSETEKAIMEQVAELAKSKSTLLVTHRLNTVRGADEIVVLNRGVVEERGTHDQLLANAGLYAELVRLHQPPTKEDPISANL